MIKVLAFISAMLWCEITPIEAFGEILSCAKRDFRLGYKVFFGALVLVGGLYYANHAFRFGSVLGEREALLYLFLGMAGIGVGIGCILAYGFAVFPS